MKTIITTFLLLATFLQAQDVVWLKESQKRLSWEDAVQYCENQGAKLPSRKTMKDVWLKHGKTSEIDGFDLSVSYWTSTQVKENKNAAYPFYFGVGKEGWYYKEDHYGARCVK